MAAALLVIVAYALRASGLIRYPWDWSPDEGLFLGWARLLLEAPTRLYQRSVVPLPESYGPVFPALLAPIVHAFPRPLAAARMLAAVWTGLGGWSGWTS